MSTPILDKYGLHPMGGYCTCFSDPYGTCKICKAVKEQVKRWDALSPEDRKKAEEEHDRTYPKTRDNETPGR